MTDKALVRTNVLSRLASLAGVILIVVLAVYHQPYYPATWLDEGFVLQGAINLVRYGQYAMRSVEGFRILDQPLIANGPGVVLPIAAAFLIGGVGLLQARLVMAAFMTLTAVAFFALARRLYGSLPAWFSTFLLLAVPVEGFVLYGRHALGLVPALGYFLAGYVLWLTALERSSLGHTLGAGLLFGLATVTKSPYTLLIPVLLAAALLERFYYRRGRTRIYVLVLVVILVCIGIWYAAQLVLVGWPNFGAHLEALQSSAQVTVLAFRPKRIPGNLWYVLRSGWPLYVAPGLVYAGWACRKRDAGGNCPGLVLMGLLLLWLAWFALVSVGLHRYALEPYLMGLLFTGGVVQALLRFVRRGGLNPLERGARGIGLRAAAALLIVTMAIGGVVGFAGNVAHIRAAPDTSAQQFAGYLAQHVKPREVVESWEWEIAALADLNYHHPTNDVVDKLTAVLQFDERVEIDYDALAYHPDYLIDGPFSKWTRLYGSVLNGGCCKLVVSFGPYDLYKVNPPGTAQSWRAQVGLAGIAAL